MCYYILTPITLSCHPWTYMRACCCGVSCSLVFAFLVTFYSIFSGRAGCNRSAIMADMEALCDHVEEGLTA